MPTGKGRGEIQKHGEDKEVVNKRDRDRFMDKSWQIKDFTDRGPVKLRESFGVYFMDTQHKYRWLCLMI